MPCRTGKLHRRIDGDTAGIRRRANHLPVTARFFHFHHRHAHRVLPLTGFVEVPVRHTVRKQHPVIDVFMVQRQQTMFRVLLPLRQAKPRHTVVVHPRLHGLFVGRVAGIRLKCRHVVFDARRVTPAIKRAGNITFRHPHRIVRGNGNTGKPKRHRFCQRGRLRYRGNGAIRFDQKGKGNGSTRHGAHLEKTTAGEENLCNLGENRVSAAVSDVVAMFFFKNGFEGSAHSGFLSLAKR